MPCEGLVRSERWGGGPIVWNRVLIVFRAFYRSHVAAAGNGPCGSIRGFPVVALRIFLRRCRYKMLVLLGPITAAYSIENLDMVRRQETVSYPLRRMRKLPGPIRCTLRYSSQPFSRTPHAGKLHATKYLHDQRPGSVGTSGIILH